jgi:hypothetical protein
LSQKVADFDTATKIGADHPPLSLFSVFAAAAADSI